MNAKENSPMAEEPLPRFYTVNEVAEMLKVSPKTIYGLIWKKKLLRVKVGSAVRISKEALDRYLAGDQPQEAAPRPVKSTVKMPPLTWKFLRPTS